MNALDTYWKMAQLAQASYVDLQATEDAVVIESIKAAQPNNIYQFSDTQASQFIGDSGFSVVDISANANDSYGFSATLFLDNRTGDYSLAIRGTEPTTPADLAYSIAEISLWGIAAHQTISLYNYFQRLITPIGESVRQLSIEDLDHAPADGRLYVTMPRLGASGPFEDPDRGVIYLAMDSYYADNAIGVLANMEDAKLNVTGHSLGGELSQALERLFPNWIDDVYAYNTAGFHPGNADPFFHLIDTMVGNFNPEKIHNIYSYNGLEFITNTLVHTQYGERIGVLIEDQFPTLSGNHSVVLQGRSLALHALFEKIDPLFETSNGEGGAPAFPKIDALIRSGSFSQPTTYEATLGSLVRLFLNENLTNGDLEDLETFYLKLFAIRDKLGTDSGSRTIESLVAKSSNEIARAAISVEPTNSTAIAYRYALKQLNPFVVIGVDYQTTHNSHGELDLFNPEEGTGTLSDKWIEDRAAMLVAFNEARATDAVRGESQLSASTGGIVFNGYDGAGTHFSILPSGNPLGIRSLVIFDNDQAHEITGQMKDDHLYGDGGGDVISGADGVDWLEGGDGDDEIYGGNDGDWLFGGAGNDRLDGGNGANALDGGSGFDSYAHHSNGNGFDYIRDDDGELVIDGVRARGGKKITDNIYLSDDNRSSYRIDGSTLYVNGSSVVLEFQQGDLGIVLEDNLVEAERAAQATGNMFTGPAIFNFSRNYYISESFGSIADDYVVAAGGGVRERQVNAGIGNDVVLVDNDATVDRGTFVQGGSGGDYIWGSDHRDALFGEFGSTGENYYRYFEIQQEESIVEVRQSVNNFYVNLDENGWNVRLLQGFEEKSIEELTYWEPTFQFLGSFTATSAAQLILGTSESTDATSYWNDVIEGKGGDDEILGGIGSDELFGGDGDDYIVGAGIDIPGLGTDELSNAIRSILSTEMPDSDHLDGGDGDDIIFGGSGRLLDRDWLEGGSGNDVLYGGYVVEGGTGSDALINVGPSRNQSGAPDGAWLFGGEGDDVIMAGAGANVDLGAGADTMIVNFIAGQGRGAITVHDVDGAQRFVLSTDGYNSASLDSFAFTRDGNDLIVTFLEKADGENEVIWKDWFSAPMNGATLTYIGGVQKVSGLNRIWDWGAPTAPFVPFTLQSSGTFAAWTKQDVADHTRQIIRYSDNASSVVGGNAADSISGDEGDNLLSGLEGDDYLKGGEGADRLDGGAGNDILSGGAGDDIYVYGSGYGRDRIVDSDTAIGNVDTIRFTAAVLPSDVILTRSLDNPADLVLSVNGTTNELTVHNWFYLDDRFQVERVEFSDGTLWETSTLAQAAIVGTSNGDAIVGLDDISDVMQGLEGNDSLIGYSGDDVLDGGAGIDILEGGAGNDTYIVDLADVVVEGAETGNDTLLVSVNYRLPLNTENLVLTGASAINGIGNALDNVLTGNSSANVMTGLTGNDSYYVGAGDAVIEAVEGGIDSVYANVTWTLAPNLENLTLIEDAKINGTGNVLDNVLTGNSAANILTGRAGDDGYFVGNGDEVVESAGEGNDTIYSGVSWVLGNNLENLMLTGNTAINGAGNAAENLVVGTAKSNFLTGNAGNDILQGLDGDDSLSDTSGNTCFEGGVGADTMTGNADNGIFIGGLGVDLIATGIGANIVAFNLGDGQDVIGASAGADNTISLGGGIQYGNLSFSKSGSDLVLNTGGADKLTLAQWYEEGVSKSVVNLQAIVEAMSGYDPVGFDVLLDNKVERFDFEVLANEFDMAGQVSGWSLTNALLSAHLTGSDTSAIGGDLAYQYGKNGALSGIGLTYAQDVLNDPQFGSSAQALRPIENLQQGRIRLS